MVIGWFIGSVVPTWPLLKSVIIESSTAALIPENRGRKEDPIGSKLPPTGNFKTIDVIGNLRVSWVEMSSLSTDGRLSARLCVIESGRRTHSACQPKDRVNMGALNVPKFFEDRRFKFRFHLFTLSVEASRLLEFQFGVE